MKPVIPSKSVGVQTTIGKNQPEYQELPAVRVDNCIEQPVTTEWEFSSEELARVNAGERIRLTCLTFGHPLQPILIEVTNPYDGES